MHCQWHRSRNHAHGALPLTRSHWQLELKHAPQLVDHWQHDNTVSRDQPSQALHAVVASCVALPWRATVEACSPHNDAFGIGAYVLNDTCKQTLTARSTRETATPDFAAAVKLLELDRVLGKHRNVVPKKFHSAAAVQWSSLQGSLQVGNVLDIYGRQGEGGECRRGRGWRRW